MAKLFRNANVKKKVVAVLTCMLISVCSLAIFGACKKVENIGVAKQNMPQDVYVLGSDLNLEGGSLTVIIKGKEQQVSLTDDGVSITGYDKDKLGEQVLTITYEEKTTTMKVTVVPRMEASQYETAYFVGESFNSSIGMLTVTADNGTREDMAFDDARVSVRSFDSSSAGEGKEVVLNYADGTVSYDVAIPVSVYEISSMEFYKLPKNVYKSHETTLDVTGGLLVKGGTLSRYIELTADMVTGFDVSAATVAHRETPLKQTLTVTYLGKTKTYDIDIKFSDTSLMNLRAAEMKNVEIVDGNIPSTLTETMGENALDAMDAYFSMADAEKAALTTADVEAIAKVAAIYGLNKWKQAFATYSDAFVLVDDSSMKWNCADYTKTVAAYELLLSDLDNENSVINTDGAVLASIVADMADVVVYGEKTVADVLAVVCSPDSMTGFAEQLSLMITLYETLKVIPDNWDSATLKTAESEAAIQTAWAILNATEYYHLNFRGIYTLMSKWRTNNDYFDILYTYYYEKGDYEAMDAFKDKHLPYELEELYGHLYNVLEQYGYLTQGLWYLCYDTSKYMFSYDQAVKLSTEILSSDNAMLKTLYEKLKFDYLVGDGNGGYAKCTFTELLSFFRSTTFGYLYQMGAYVDIAEFEGLWSEYTLAVEDLASYEKEDKEYYGSAKHAAAAESLLREYFQLSPLQQFVFMYSVNPYYKPSAAGRLPEYFWDNSEMVYSEFVNIIYKHYEATLSEDAFDAFVELMKATEETANSLVNQATYKERFVEAMEAVDATLNALKKADASAYTQFDEKLGWLYNTYKGYATKFDTNSKEALGDWKDEFEELLLACRDAYVLTEINNQLGQPNVAAYIAAVTKAQKIADKILACGDPSILTAYYFDEFTVKNVIPWIDVPNFGGTLDYLMFYIREQYASLMIGSGFDGKVLLDHYNEMDMSDFFVELSYLTYNHAFAGQIGSADPDAKFFTDIDQVVKIMKNYRELTVDQQHFLLSIDNYWSYHTGLLAFAVEVMGEDVANAVYGLTMVERAYVNYAKDPTGDDGNGNTYLSMLDEILQGFLGEYADMMETIDNETKSKFNQYFGEMYTYYMEKCQQAGLNTTLNK